MTRRTIDVEGFNHGDQPVPAAARISNLLVTGGIFGLDPETGIIPDEADAQCALMFHNLFRILEEGGATIDHIVRLTFYTSRSVPKDVINAKWLETFPEPQNRPARHIINNDHLIGNTLMLCEVIALVE